MQGVIKLRRKSVAAPPPYKALHHHHHHQDVEKSTLLLKVAESFYLRERQTNKQRGEKRKSGKKKVESGLKSGLHRTTQYNTPGPSNQIMTQYSLGNTNYFGD